MIRNRVLVLFFLLALCFTGCNQKSTESKTLTEFSRSGYESFRGLYFYPSTIRMLAKVVGNEYGAGFSELKRARIYYSLTDDDPILLKKTFTELQDGLKEEGFEVLMQVKSPGSHIHVYLYDGEISDYVFFMRGDDGDLIAELTGNLSPESIKGIMQMDLTKAASLLDLIPSENEAKSDSLKSDSTEPVDKQ